jgi:hypothetical protein
MKPIAYTYEADTHCPKCARERFGDDCEGTDNEGNPVGAIWSWSEWYEYGEGNQILGCGTCRDVIATHEERLTDNLDKFTRAYLVCALWSSTDDEGKSLDDDYFIEDLSDESLKSAIADCKDFQESNAELLSEAGSLEQNGHDFWLTRNRHGAGFWDRGYGGVGDKLTDASHIYGGVYLYVGDDGKIYGG